MPDAAVGHRSWVRPTCVAVLAAVLTTAAAPATASAGGAVSAAKQWPATAMHTWKPHPVPIKYRKASRPKTDKAGFANVTAADGTQGTLVPDPAGGPATSVWQVSYDSGFTTAATGPAAKAAFQAAVDTWSRIVTSSVPITVDASYAALAGDTIGQAGPTSAIGPCSCLGDGASFYPIALANALEGRDIDVAQADIRAQFTSSPPTGLTFYYGTDGAPPSGQIDFESVVLHELGHGLGFAGSFDMPSGSSAVVYSTTPFSFDRSIQDSAGAPMLSYASGSAQLTAAMQSGSVFWGGTRGLIANGGVRPALYAPATWQEGSSGAHLDEAIYARGDANSLMTPTISTQEAVHSPGAVAVAMMADEGWAAALPVPTAPSAPTGVTAARGDGTAAISWTAAAANGSPVTTYTATAFPDGASCSTATLSCTIGGLTNGTSYAVSVTATNGVATGPASGSANVVPAGKPAAPTAPTATAGNGGATVTWTAPPANGDPIIGYDLQRSSSSGASWSAADPTALTSTSTQSIVTGLTNGTSYVFRVAAINASGQSAPSPASAAVSPARAPDAPTAVSATRGDTTVQLQWTGPTGSGTGGSPITGYDVQWSTDGTSWSTSLPSALTDTSPVATVTRLANGQEYELRVAAVNAVGASSFASAQPVTPAGLPAAPTGLHVAGGDQQVTLGWNAVSGNGGTITGYQVESSTDGTTWSTAQAAPASTAPSTVVTNLADGTPYQFRVKAISSIGTGPWSVTSVAATPAGAPSVPALVVALPGDEQATVSFIPSSANGSPITSYDVTYSTDGGGHWTSANVAYTASPATVTGLTNGTSYVFAVAAINGVSASGYSTSSAAVIPAGKPTAPAMATATAGDAQATITFAGTSANGSPITGYLLRWSSDDGMHWSTPESFVGSPALVAGLANGTRYIFDVATVNALGVGAWSTPSAAVTPAGTPVAPTAVSATAGDSQATVSWTAPDANGAPITGYDVRYSTDSGAHWTSAGAGYSTSPAIVTGLTNGTSYVFEVAAINTVGSSGYSLSSLATREDTTNVGTAPSRTVGYGTTVKFTTRLIDRSTSQGFAGVATLLSRATSTAPWTKLTSATADSTGTVAASLRVTRTASYAWSFAGAAGHAPTTGLAGTLAVGQTVTITRTAMTVVHGHVVKFFGIVAPNALNQYVYLQRLVGSSWRATTLKAKVVKQLLPSGRIAVGYVVSVKPIATGTYTYRVYKPATAVNAAGYSAAVKLKVT